MANRHRKKQKCPYCTGRLAITGVNDLATTNPELLLEWDYSKNVSIDPTLVKAGSCKKAWWKCGKGHEWETKILNRAIKGHGCIYCSSNKVLFGYNDFLTQYPELAEEWDYEKNLEINPQDLQAKSNLKVWWKCKHCGHSWQAYISNRTSHNSSCPKCNFKLKTSFPEQVIFYYIKKKYSDAINSYSDIFSDAMEIDIYIPSLHLGIEYDGARWHSSDDAVKRERKKYLICQAEGIYLIRIRETVTSIAEEICDQVILATTEYNTKNFTAIFEELQEKLRCTIAVDLENDRKNILSSYQIKVIENSLGKLFPEIAKEWDYESNMGMTPFVFSAYSNEMVDWKCKKGHKYSSTISSRTQQKCGCPYCSGHKVWIGFNDLETIRPELAKEWDYEKNYPLLPSQFTVGSGQKVWWKCNNEKHPSYIAYIYSRTGKENTGCPYCSGQKTIEGVNDLASIFPKLAKEWNYKKNDSNLSPENISIGSSRKVWWKCKYGHEWDEIISSRTKRQTGCPYCSNHRLLKGFNDMVTTNPEIAQEWNYKKNGQFKPEDFMAGSNEKAWWICSKGHEWQTKIVARKRYGCPYCSGRLAIQGENDLATVYPLIAEEWNYNKNIDLLPSMVKSKSHKKVWWKCKNCGYEWQAQISNRTIRGDGCKKCNFKTK